MNSKNSRFPLQVIPWLAIRLSLSTSFKAATEHEPKDHQLTIHTTRIYGQADQRDPKRRVITGHTFVSLKDANGHEEFYGFDPAKKLEEFLVQFDPDHPDVEELKKHSDATGWLHREENSIAHNSERIPITQEQHQKAMEVVSNYRKNPPPYLRLAHLWPDGLWSDKRSANCIVFVHDICKATGVNSSMFKHLELVPQGESQKEYLFSFMKSS